MSGGQDTKSFEMAIKLVNSGKIKLDDIITHDFPLKEYKKAIEVALKKIDHPIKVVMTP
jgi:threonine dehydrogenase-like Zn-dependent dehydrogenase